MGGGRKAAEELKQPHYTDIDNEKVGPTPEVETHEAILGKRSATCFPLSDFVADIVECEVGRPRCDQRPLAACLVVLSCGKNVPVVLVGVKQAAHPTYVVVRIRAYGRNATRTF